MLIFLKINCRIGNRWELNIFIHCEKDDYKCDSDS